MENESQLGIVGTDREMKEVAMEIVHLAYAHPWLTFLFMIGLALIAGAIRG